MTTLHEGPEIPVRPAQKIGWSTNLIGRLSQSREDLVAINHPMHTRSHTMPAQPVLGQRSSETQPYGQLARYPLTLSDEARAQSVEALNQVLSDTMALRDLYKKHHWQASGPTFYQMHLLFDKHYDEQVELVDTIAERVQSLGGVAVAMAQDVAEMTKVERPPRGREELPVQISRLLEAHEVILSEAHRMAQEADACGDDGTNDLLVSDVIRTNEMQVWFLSEHLVDSPLVRAHNH
jgi:starvation-inducible DNA-binding protein